MWTAKLDALDAFLAKDITSVKQAKKSVKIKK